MPQPTHINAYKAELAEAENAEAQAHGRVEQLKETIATMEQSERAANEAPAEAAPEALAEEPKEESVEDLEKLHRDDLEKEAEKAGVENPEDAKNKHELAEETVAARGDEQPSDSDPAPEAASSEPSGNVVAQDASQPPISGSDEPVNEDVPSQPVTETPEGSDMPPASSEVPSEVTTGEDQPKDNA